MFIGYHDDTCSAIVLDVWEKHQNLEDMKDIEEHVNTVFIISIWFALVNVYLHSMDLS